MAINHKILIVDDEVSIRRVVELKLKNRGYRVITASNGDEGLEKIHTESPDAVITDINMPGIDGKHLCERVESLKMKRNFLTIVLTARISPDEHRWIGKMRQTRLMRKPFSPSGLVKEIDQYFQNAS